MPGSSQSISGINIVLNTIAAETLCQFADVLEESKDFTSDLHNLVKDTLTSHRRILFNGNNYSPEWVLEAEKRGLLNLKTTADALPYFVHEKNVELFVKHKVFTAGEMHARYEIMLEGCLLYTSRCV